MSASPQHRADIDGMRALAVLAVVVFHVAPRWLSGGFAGVDVFFVISGYLITSLLWRETGSEHWRFLTFLGRRVRRLAPALLTMTLAVCVAAAFLLPRHALRICESALSQPIAMQNLYFLADGEYFNGSDNKPLLHTWSLGVEEQFYFIWPFVVVYMRRRLSPRMALAATGAIAALSFGCALVLIGISPKTAFFLLPSRAWELTAGALLALAPAPAKRLPAWSAEGIGWLAALTLAASFLFVDESAPFPGWAAVPTVLATTALLAVTPQSKFLSRALAHPVPTWVGRISYSLYLWHWPVIVFMRFAHADLTNPLHAVLAVALSFGAATLSYHFIEHPIRTGSALKSTRALVTTCAALAGAVLALGVAGVTTSGFAGRFSEPARSMLTASFNADGDERCGLVFRAMHPRAPICPVSATGTEGSVLLWGNSHAAMWVGALREIAEEHHRTLFLNSHNCRPSTDSAFCGEERQRRVLSEISARGIRDVILAASWHGEYDIPDDELEGDLLDLVRRLDESSVRTWLVVDVPTGQELNPEARYLSNPDAPTIGALSRAEHEDQRGRMLRLFERAAEISDHVRLIDPTDDFCDDSLCRGGLGDVIFYRDSNHLTGAGARVASARFAPAFTAGDELEP